MGEVEFRAWDKDMKQMISWEYLTSMLNGNMICVPQRSLIPDNAKITDIPESLNYRNYRGNPFEIFKGFIFEYIGLKDKNNVKIYKGDIIEYEYIGIVAYGFYTVHDMNDCGEQDVYGYYIKAIHTRSDKTTYNLDKNMEDYEYMEVIGNIYENPELKIYT